jgi:outer membrane protein TolC
MRFEEAKKRYCEEKEDIAIKATNMFFNLLLAQMNITIAEQNLINNDTLYKIAEKRFQFGKIAENELLQIQLGQLNSDNELEQARINFEVQLLSFKSFLGIKNFDKLLLIPPVKVYDIEVNVQKAIAEAKANRSDAIAFERSLLEAQSYLKNTQSQSRFNANLYCSFGLTQQSEVVLDAYRELLDQESITLGVHVPILDWGLSRGRVKLAESNQNLVKTIISQQKIDFEQNIYLKVMSFNTLPNQLFVAARADTISKKRYEVTKDRYLIGKIGITEVNIALSDQNNARRSFISALRNYWVTFRELKKLTCFDFIKNEPLKFDISEFQL